MSKTAHTPGPWVINPDNPTFISSADNTADICEIEGWPLEYAAEEDANRARIVACVNACEGIADPSVVPEAIEALRGFASGTAFDILRQCGEDDADYHMRRERHAMLSIRAILSKLDGSSS